MSMATITPYDQIQAGRRAAADRYEVQALRLVLHQSEWSLAAAARALGCAVSTLARALERHPELEAERREKTPPPGPRARKSA